jgi:hypothetical protein
MSSTVTSVYHQSSGVHLLVNSHALTIDLSGRLLSSSGTAISQHDIDRMEEKLREKTKKLGEIEKSRAASLVLAQHEEGGTPVFRDLMGCKVQEPRRFLGHECFPFEQTCARF